MARQEHYHQVERRRQPRKRWGVYSHRVVEPTHPLVQHVNTRFDAPRSHVYEVTCDQAEAVGVRVLAQSEEAGLHLAVSSDGLRFVYFQGHPEYDVHSLLKEYKREVERYVAGERDEFPPYPENYFPPAAQAILDEHRQAVLAAVSADGRVPAASPRGERGEWPAVPETEVHPYLENTWTDTGKALFNNWLGLVYLLTDEDRTHPFGPRIDPQDPLSCLDHR